MKFGKVQQIAAFEDNGLPLFDGNPAKPEQKNNVVWVSSVWDKWLNAEEPKQEEKPQAEQPKLF